MAGKLRLVAALTQRAMRPRTMRGSSAFDTPHSLSSTVRLSLAFKTEEEEGEEGVSGEDRGGGGRDVVVMTSTCIYIRYGEQ